MTEPTRVHIAVANATTLSVWTTGPNRDKIPAMALLRKDFPTALEAEDYVVCILRAVGAVDDNVVSLPFVSSGHTIVGGKRYAARVVPLQPGH